MAADARRRHAPRLLVISATVSKRTARGRRAPASCLSCCRIRAAADICRDGLRPAATPAGGDRLYQSAGSRVQRSDLCFRAAAAPASRFSCTTTVRIRGVGPTTSAHWIFRAAVSGVPAGPGLDQPSGIRRCPASEQHHLQQHPQYRRRQQCDQYRYGHEPERPDQDHSAGASSWPSSSARGWRAGGGTCARFGRRNRAGAPAFSRAEGRRASKPDATRRGPAAGWRRPSEQATARSTTGAAAAGNARAAASGRKRCRAVQAIAFGRANLIDPAPGAGNTVSANDRQHTARHDATRCRAVVAIADCKPYDAVDCSKAGCTVAAARSRGKAGSASTSAARSHGQTATTSARQGSCATAAARGGGCCKAGIRASAEALRGRRERSARLQVG